MNGRLRWIAAITALAIGLGLAWFVTIGPAATDPPNIVLVLFDDADKAAVEELPNISSLIADQGMTFDNFYATQALCCPSRASLLTGEYVHNHGVLRNGGNDGGWDEFKKRGHEGRSVARALTAQGFRTALFGKYLNQYGQTSESEHHVPRGWSRWFAIHGLHYYDYRATTNGGKIVKYGSDRRDYATSVIARRARSWIGGFSDDTTPFFAFVSMLAPHAPYDVPREHKNDAKGTKPPSVDKESFNEADVSDKPAYIRRRSRLSREDRTDIISRYRKRVRMMLAVDDFVGDLVSQLQSSGELDNTYIFISSDNGWMQGEHRIPSKKLVPYEESTNLPLIVRGPGIVPGTNSSALVSMVDLFPTFVDLAGGTELRDGRSVVPLLNGTSIDWRDQLLIEDRAKRGVPRFFGVVTGQHKYVRYETKEEELYDLALDPEEVSSLHGSPAHAALKADLRSKLDALSDCSGASCRAADGGPAD